MRDPANQPDYPRKDLGDGPIPPLTFDQLQAYAEFAALAARSMRRRGRRRDGEAGAGIPADPRKPNTLSGGAAAALDFD